MTLLTVMPQLPVPVRGLLAVWTVVVLNAIKIMLVLKPVLSLHISQTVLWVVLIVWPVDLMLLMVVLQQLLLLLLLLTALGCALLGLSPAVTPPLLLLLLLLLLLQLQLLLLTVRLFLLPLLSV